jgi:hypothetical protein
MFFSSCVLPRISQIFAKFPEKSAPIGDIRGKGFLNSKLKSISQMGEYRFAKL